MDGFSDKVPEDQILRDIAGHCCWAPQTGPQTLAYCARWVSELFYGGSRGGGKSDLLLGDFAQDVERYGASWRGVFFRRTYDELEEIIHRSHQLYPLMGAHWLAVKRTWVWPNGAYLKMRFLERLSDAGRYQGHQYTWIGFDELTNWPDAAPYDVLKACLRHAERSVPVQRIRASGNPGGPGHVWTKQRFVDPAPLGFVPIYDPESKLTKMYIPARLKDNKILLDNDPGYEGRIKASGPPALVRCWLDGDWNSPVGNFFPEFGQHHIVRPFKLPPSWVKFRSIDWGSYHPFSVGWWAVANGEQPDLTDRSPSERPYFRPNCLVRYKEYYGCVPGRPNTGLKMNVEEVAAGILSRSRGEEYTYTVADPACFAENGGPSIAETFARSGVVCRPGDNKRLPGWEQVRSRLVGIDGEPMVYMFDCCRDMIRTLPGVTHDEHRPSDVDTDCEDHCADEFRYAAMSRPFMRLAPKDEQQRRGIEATSFNELFQLRQKERAQR